LIEKEIIFPIRLDREKLFLPIFSLHMIQLGSWYKKWANDEQKEKKKIVKQTKSE